jgi:hypothetical protein
MVPRSLAPYHRSFGSPADLPKSRRSITRVLDKPLK